MVYGTWRLLDTKPTPQEINRRLRACLDLGITTIDTAEIYGLYEVEQLLGAALALSPGLRNKFEFVTKAGIYVPCSFHPERRTAHYNATGPRLLKSIDKSLHLLGTDHVELFLVHRPDWLTRADDAAAGLNELLRSGKIRAAGVSNYSTSQLDLLNSHMERPLVTNQIEFSLLHPEPINDGTLHQCEKLGVLPMAWSPLAGGAYSIQAILLPRVWQKLPMRCHPVTTERHWNSLPTHGSSPTRVIRCRSSARTNSKGCNRRHRLMPLYWNGKTGTHSGKRRRAAGFHEFLLARPIKMEKPADRVRRVFGFLLILWGVALSLEWAGSGRVAEQGLVQMNGCGLQSCYGLEFF